ncbi:hypothetical protein [Polluticoccus soli]|nr:hypothetical protein [Flavipsychrobacter sp. JY13-12]
MKTGYSIQTAPGLQSISEPAPLGNNTREIVTKAATKVINK